MVTLLMKNEIIALHRQGISNREISKRLGISRNTTNKYVREANNLFKQIENETDESKIFLLQNELVSRPVRKGVWTRKVFTGELKQRFYELISLDEERDTKLGINKQKLTASLLHRTLKSEGFDVGITTIQTDLKYIKTNIKKPLLNKNMIQALELNMTFMKLK